MSARQLTPVARQVESQLESKRSNSLQIYLAQKMARTVQGKGLSLSNYDIFAVRRNDQVGLEILGPTKVAIGKYTEEALYGLANSPPPHFRSTIRTIAAEDISITSLREIGQDFSTWLALVQRGESVAITQAGRVVARIVPAEAQATSSAPVQPVEWPDFAARRRAIFGDKMVFATAEDSQKFWDEMREDCI